MRGRHLSVALVVDLSKPDELWLTVDRWLDVIRARVTTIVRDTQNSDPSVKDQLQQAAWLRVGQQHEVLVVGLNLVCFLLILQRWLNVYVKLSWPRNGTIGQVTGAINCCTLGGCTW